MRCATFWQTCVLPYSQGHLVSGARLARGSPEQGTRTALGTPFSLAGSASCRVAERWLAGVCPAHLANRRHPGALDTWHTRDPAGGRPWRTARPVLPDAPLWRPCARPVQGRQIMRLAASRSSVGRVQRNGTAATHARHGGSRRASVRGPGNTLRMTMDRELQWTRAWSTSDPQAIYATIT